MDCESTNIENRCFETLKVFQNIQREGFKEM